MPPGWRITEVWQKSLYIVVGYAVSAAFFFALRTWVFAVSTWQYEIIALVLNLAYVVLAVRTFRGYLEPVEPARPWWRWTGRPKAGFWLGGLHAFATVGVLPEFWPQRGHSADIGFAILNVLAVAIPALGYLNSSIRLQRHPEIWSQHRPKKARVAVDAANYPPIRDRA